MYVSGVLRRGGRSRSKRCGRGERGLAAGRGGECARRALDLDLDLERALLRLGCRFTRFNEALGDGERLWWRFEDGVVSCSRW